MTQVPEAYKQAKKHILFHNYCIKKKLVTFNSRMNSASKAIRYAEVINMYSLHELFNSTSVHNTLQWYIQCTLVLVHKMCIFCWMNIVN